VRRRPPLCSRWRDERLVRMHCLAGRAAAATVARVKRARAHRGHKPALLSDGGGEGAVARWDQTASSVDWVSLLVHSHEDRIWLGGATADPYRRSVSNGLSVKLMQLACLF